MSTAAEGIPGRYQGGFPSIDGPRQVFFCLGTGFSPSPPMSSHLEQESINLSTSPVFQTFQEFVPSLGPCQLPPEFFFSLLVGPKGS